MGKLDLNESICLIEMKVSTPRLIKSSIINARDIKTNQGDG